MTALKIWKFIDTPIRPQAAKRLETATAADRCVAWLKSQGFEITLVQRGLSCPRIFIKHSPLCKSLTGALWMFERTKQGESRHYTAKYFECEVRWMDGGEL